MLQSHLITNRAKGLVFLVEHGPNVWNSVIGLCIFQCHSFHKVKITEYYNIVHFYNSKSITLIENIKML